MFNKKLFILLNEYHDDSDPGLMDKILSYLEDIHSEDDEFMEVSIVCSSLIYHYSIK